MTEEEKKIALNLLEEFIYKIRRLPIHSIVYKYYVSDISQSNEANKIKIEFDFESLKLQVKRKILSTSNNYWGFKLSDVAIVEKIDLNLLKKEIEILFTKDLNIQEEEIACKEVEKGNLEDDFLMEIIEKNELLPPVKEILKNNREFPYKNNKINAFIELYLNTEQILKIMCHYETLTCVRSYVEKFRSERQLAIKEGKIKIYPLSEVIQKYTK